MTPTEFEESSARIGLIYIPEVTHPIVAGAQLNQLINGGGLFYADPELVDPIGKLSWYFGGSHASFATVGTMLDLHDWSSVGDNEIDAANAVIANFIGFTVNFMGPRAAWRTWNAIWSEHVSGVQVKISPQEDVAELVMGKNRREYPGWDSLFQSYRQRVEHVLNYTLDQERFQSLQMAGHFVAADSYVRVALASAIEHVWGRKNANVNHSLYPGMQLRAAGEPRSIGEQVLMTRPDLVHPKAIEKAVNAFAEIGGESYFDLERVAELGDKYRELKEHQLGKPPAWPVAGLPEAVLYDLKEEQQFAFPRELPGGHTVPHSGTDLPAWPGQPVVASYDGVIKSINKGVPNSSKTPAGGNYVNIDSATPRLPGLSLVHGYGHMLDPAQQTPEQLKLITEKIQGILSYSEAQVQELFDSWAKLKVGDRVKQGQVIGFVGSTGNSNKEHLHWSFSVARKTDTGQSLEKKQIDPELVLEHGFIEALRMSNFAFGSPEIFGEAILALRAAGDPSLSPGLRGARAGFDKELKDFLASIAAPGVEELSLGEIVANAATPPPIPMDAQTQTTAQQLGQQLGALPIVQNPFQGTLATGAISAGLAATGVPGLTALAPVIQALLVKAWDEAKAKKQGGGAPAAGDVLTLAKAKLSASAEVPTEQEEALARIAAHLLQ